MSCFAKNYNRWILVLAMPLICLLEHAYSGSSVGHSAPLVQKRTVSSSRHAAPVALAGYLTRLRSMDSAFRVFMIGRSGQAGGCQGRLHQIWETR